MTRGSLSRPCLAGPVARMGMRADGAHTRRVPGQNCHIHTCTKISRVGSFWALLTLVPDCAYVSQNGGKFIYSTNVKTSRRDMERGFPPSSIIIFFFFLALQCSMQDPSSPTWDLAPSALEAWLLNHWTAREVSIILVASLKSQKQRLAQTELCAQSALR